MFSEKDHILKSRGGETMLIKTVLNRIEKFKSYVYGEVTIDERGGMISVVIDIRARKNSMAVCSLCGERRAGYDRLESRLYAYVPLWGIQVFFRYSPRRVACPKDGVVVESVPWASGKCHLTSTYKVFLARWAKRLSWKETAEIFKSSWDSVFRAVKYVVEYGLVHRNLNNIKQIGVDEIQVFRGHKYLTLVYQLDKHKRRLLWSGPKRKAKTLLKFFRQFGKERCLQLQFVCSDMWAPYLKVIKKKAPRSLNVLDRFHIMKKFNEAIDEVRRQEVKRLKDCGEENVLIRGRWLLLKRVARLTENQVVRLKHLLKSNLISVRAYLMREDFQRFWEYKTPAWADKFLEDWIERAMYSKITPMKKVAKMLLNHKPLILNWFRAGGELSSGPIEGLNLKAKLTMRKAYGFRSIDNLQVALYHTLGHLPEPELTHKFC